MNDLGFINTQIADWYHSWFNDNHLRTGRREPNDFLLDADNSKVLFRMGKVVQLIGIEQIPGRESDFLRYFVLNSGFYHQEIKKFRESFENHLDNLDDDPWYKRRFAKLHFQEGALNFNYSLSAFGKHDCEKFEGIVIYSNLKRGIPRGPHGGVSSKIISEAHNRIVKPSHKVVLSNLR